MHIEMNGFLSAANEQSWRVGRSRIAVGSRVFLVFLIVLVVVSLVFWAQIEKRFVFYPDSHLVASPGQLGLAYEEVFFETEDGLSLHGWFVPGSGEVTWLWFHGNGGNISHRLDEVALFHHRLGVNQFIFDYRGYGKSEGKPTERGTYTDARAALANLQARGDLDRDKVVYFGRSLGTAVAVELATAQEPMALVLVAPFTSVSNMARIVFPIAPLHRLVRGRYDSLERIAGIRTPLLVVHGDRDQTIPLTEARRLFDAANEPKRFLVLPGSGHNDTYIAGGRVYWDAMEDFLNFVSNGDVPSYDLPSR